MAIAGRPLDLASLIRSSSNDSFPYFYFILLFSTLISVGVSFARILTKGKRPVIKNIVSFKFFKVILMLIFKLLIQSYILSMAVKSMMFKFVSKGRKVYKEYKRFLPIFLQYQYFPHPSHDTEGYRELEERWYRGLCLHWFQDSTRDPTQYFCRIHKNNLTFTQATVYVPLVLILILYLPTITYVIYLSNRFYGFEKWISELINDPVYFIFPILTSLSFYEKSKLNFQENHENNGQHSAPQNVSPNNSQSMDFTEQHGNIGHIDDDGIETIENTFETTIETTDIRNNTFLSGEIEKQFSISQSNTLYFLFCASTSLCIFADWLHQWMRGKRCNT